MTRSRRRAAGARFIVLTGLSGSGKSQAVRALEDLGYYCVDNLPVSLLPLMAELASGAEAEHARVAVVVDVRAARFQTDFPRTYRDLKRRGTVKSTLIFLEANHPELVRRFSETRRPHPLAPDQPVTDGIAAERAALRPIRALADKVIDTSSMSVHELREALVRLVSGRRRASRLVLTFLSFGFHYGPPQEADVMFDVRFLKNPHWVPALRGQTGRDRAVAAYMQRQPLTRALLRRLASFLRFLVPQYVDEGKAYLTVAIGCTGGRHRSVYMAEALKRALAGRDGVTVRVRHRDLTRTA
jgi:UPF0042 nucleotide-binding protein